MGNTSNGKIIRVNLDPQMKILNLLIVVLLLRSGAILGDDYYVNIQHGNDNNNGSYSHPWKTLDKVNSVSFEPGDRIFLRRGQVWRESLIIRSSGMKGNWIEYGAFGEGNNPLIKRTDTYSEWSRANASHKGYSKKRIWRGAIDGRSNYWGAMINGERIPNYKQKSRPAMETENVYFYSPPNKGVFYLRYNSDNPPSIEVGARRYGISIKEASYIRVTNIDVTGPGGGNKQKGNVKGLIEIVAGSTNIQVHDSTLTNSDSFGIWSDLTTKGISYNQLKSYNNRSTGIYNNATNGVIENCESYNNGLLLTDSGDMGGIGTQGSNILISNNNVYNNGNLHYEADFEVSIVGATGPIFVNDNFIHECGQGCLQVALGGHGTQIKNNIIRGYGTAIARPGSYGKYSGIRIGGGGGNEGAKNIVVQNNIITYGSNINGHSAISVTGQDSAGLVIDSNVIFNNSVNYISIHKKAQLGQFILSRNTYHSSTNKHWNFRGQVIQSLRQWQNTTGQDTFATTRKPKYINQSKQFKSKSDFKLVTE